jgi:hypothetical protein
VVLLLSVDSGAWLTTAVKDHQRIEKELDDINHQSQSSLAASKALQAFNSTIYTLRTAVVAALVAQAASANCSVKFPALYQQDDPSAAAAAQARSKAQLAPLDKTEAVLDDGLAKVKEKGVPLADYLREVDEKSRDKLGGKGAPSGRRADLLIKRLNEAGDSGLKANLKGKQARTDSEAFAKAALEAAKKVSEAATKNDEISGQLTQLCDKIKALPKDPAALPASIAAAVGLAAQGPGLHAKGSGPLADGLAAVAKAQQAQATAKKSRVEFFKAVPGDEAPRGPKLEYVTKANDLQTRLAAKMKEAQPAPPPAPSAQQ